MTSARNCQLQAVQARAAKLPGPPMQASAVKLGDDPGHSKIQVDPRLQEEEQRRVIEFVSSMARTLPKAPSQPVSRALARAYHAVTRGRVLMLDY